MKQVPWMVSTGAYQAIAAREDVDDDAGGVVQKHRRLPVKRARAASERSFTGAR